MTPVAAVVIVGLVGRLVRPTPEDASPAPEVADLDLQLRPALRPVALTHVERLEPTPGYLYQVLEADRAWGPRSIAERALRTAVLEAAERKGWSTEDAQELVEAIADARRLQLAYWDLVLAGWWNDLIYGTWGNARGEHVGPHGRTIRLHKQSPNNRLRIAQGLAPMRNVERLDAGTSRRARVIDRAWAVERPFLMLPRLNGGRLLRGQVTTQGVRWRDGSSSLSPPPPVARLGWASVDAPAERKAA